MTDKYEPIDPEFDLIAQERRAEAARAARMTPPYVYDRQAVIDAARAAAELAEVPESPKVDQEPELGAMQGSSLEPQPIESGDCSHDPIKVDVVKDTPSETVANITRADG